MDLHACATIRLSQERKVESLYQRPPLHLLCKRDAFGRLKKPLDNLRAVIRQNTEPFLQTQKARTKQ